MSHPGGDASGLERAIAGALRATIHDHGPITFALVTSAVKRVVGNLANVCEDVSAASDTRGRAGRLNGGARAGAHLTQQARQVPASDAHGMK